MGIKQTTEGPKIIEMTKDMINQVFEEFPVVADAYAKYVPGVRPVRRCKASAEAARYQSRNSTIGTSRRGCGRSIGRPREARAKISGEGKTTSSTNIWKSQIGVGMDSGLV